MAHGTTGRAPAEKPRHEEKFSGPVLDHWLGTPDPTGGRVPPGPPPLLHHRLLRTVPSAPPQKRFVGYIPLLSHSKFCSGVARHVADYMADGESAGNYQPRDWPMIAQHKDWSVNKPAAFSKNTGDSDMWGNYNDTIHPSVCNGIPDMTTSLDRRKVSRAYADEKTLVRFTGYNRPMHKYYKFGQRRGQPLWEDTCREAFTEPAEMGKETRKIMKSYKNWAPALVSERQGASLGLKSTDLPEAILSLTFSPVAARDKLYVFDGTKKQRDEN